MSDLNDKYAAVASEIIDLLDTKKLPPNVNVAIPLGVGAALGAACGMSRDDIITALDSILGDIFTAVLK